MSLYNALFGVSNISGFLLKMLGLTEEQCGRFRDCYLEGGDIVIYTRNGGGNRELYQSTIDELAKHPCYLKDYDDDYDCTYAYIIFKVPDEYKDDVANLPNAQYTPSEKWELLLKSMEK